MKPTKKNLVKLAEKMYDQLNKLYDKEPELLEDMGFGKTFQGLQEIITTNKKELQ